jgi:hypothetical protein
MDYLEFRRTKNYLHPFILGRERFYYLASGRPAIQWLQFGRRTNASPADQPMSVPPIFDFDADKSGSTVLTS